MSCPDCYTGSIHNHGTPQGHEETVHGVRTYVAGPSSRKAKSSTIIFLTDAFGLALVNNLLLADRYADDTGCRVLVPNLMPGGGLSVQSMTHGDVMKKPPAGGTFDALGQLKRLWALIMMLILGIPWLIRAYPTRVYPEILRFARAVRKELDDAATTTVRSSHSAATIDPPGFSDQGKGLLGVCGFCWGGYGSTKLCTETAVALPSSSPSSSAKRLIDAHFCAHPSFVSAPGMIVDAITTFGVPYSIASASKDFMVNEKVAAQTEAVVRQKLSSSSASEEENTPRASSDTYEIKVYKDCNHGFAIRSDPGNKIEAAAAEDAARQAVDWFNRWLS